jgi:UDP-N-acetylglucosamine--N-acetylmuramyl-(pentapeptide) pyrophosphoryl-undecaprenol N-acetylglucosamine transferase
MMKILIASGGSGGHIFPAVSLAKELEKKSAEIIFVASKRRLDRKILHGAPYRKAYLTANPMPYTFGLRALLFPFKLILDILEGLGILIKFRPDAVVGFGGYTSGAILLLATFMRIKTVIHEQNVIPGRTNRLLDRRVDKVAISFDETRKYFKNKNTALTGNPLRKESLEECRESASTRFGLDVKRFTVLVMGGSQGASSLNNLVSKSLIGLSQEEKEKIQVVHIAGMKDFGNFKDFYSQNGMEGRVFEFVESINEAYSVCDLAISRSGAAAIFELAAFAKPMVLIPYPGRKNNQRFNAMFLAKKNAAVHKDERSLQKNELRDLIRELMNNSERRKELSENAKKLSVTDGAKRLMELVLN